MKKIIEYNILEEKNFVEKLVRSVHNAIQEGWQPYGDVLVQIYNGVDEYGESETNTYFLQVIVKYEE